MRSTGRLFVRVWTWCARSVGGAVRRRRRERRAAGKPGPKEAGAKRAAVWGHVRAFDGVAGFPESAEKAKRGAFVAQTARVLGRGAALAAQKAVGRWYGAKRAAAGAGVPVRAGGRGGGTPAKRAAGAGLVHT